MGATSLARNRLPLQVLCGSLLKQLTAKSRWFCEQAGTCAVIDALEILPLFEFRTGYAEDKGLSADELDSKYNPFGDGEHPLFPRFMWREAVLNKDTISGYWAWLVKSIEQSEGLVS
jgi:hypothetical protein